MKDNKWVRLLAYITGFVNPRLLLQCEHLAAENRILRSQLPTRLRLPDAQRSTLAEISKRLGRKYLVEVACVAKPATILAWYRRLIAQKFDSSKRRSDPGRPRMAPGIDALIVHTAREPEAGGPMTLLFSSWKSPPADAPSFPKPASSNARCDRLSARWCVGRRYTGRR
jgi:putative transposase